MEDVKMKAGITPSTNVYCCSYIPLDNTYHNTIYFGDKTQQHAYFAGKVKYTFNSLTYQRVNTNAIRVEKNAEDLMNCNYLMFQNSAYGSKWFYAFITEVNYINDVTTELVYELDVMQSWFFDFTLEKCFVEREHTATDNYFQFIKEEGLEVGPYCYGDVVNSKNFSSLTCAVMTATDSNGNTFRQDSDNGDVNKDLRPGGKYSGTWSACNIYYYTKMADYFNLIKKLNEKGNIDEVVAVYMVPSPFVRLTPSDSSLGLSGSVTTDTPLSTLVPVYLGDFNGYRPKNKKLYCYPYNFLVADAIENQRIFKYELFNINANQTNPITFNEFCTVTPNPTACTIPYRYEGVTDNDTSIYDFSNSLNLSNFPICGYLSEAYKAWVAQNTNSIAMGLYSGALQGAIGGGMTAAMATGGMGILAGAAIGAGTSTIGGIFGALKQNASAKELPNKASGAAIGDVATMSNSRRFKYINRHITYEYAKQIDDFFTMYGYKICELKVPNINVRPEYTYCKTIGCNIRGNIPVQYARQICEIFDAGVTHWRNGDHVGNYSVSNLPATRTQAAELHLDSSYVYQDDDYEAKTMEIWEKSKVLYDKMDTRKDDE